MVVLAVNYCGASRAAVPGVIVMAYGGRRPIMTEAIGSVMGRSSRHGLAAGSTILAAQGLWCMLGCYG